MADIHNVLNKLIGSEVKLLFVFALVLVVIVWRFTPIMPHVFYGDDLNYFLAFKDGQCGTVASQLLTTACQDKFRPVAAGFVVLLFNLFDSSITSYMIVNVLLQAISATLAYAIALRLSKGSFVVAFSIAVAVAASRFASYQVTQVIGPVEGLALPLFLGVIYSVIRADENQKQVFRWGWVAILLSFLLIHNHERYIVVAAWLGIAFILLPNFRALPKKNVVSLLIACVTLPVFYITYKTLVLGSPFMVGTGGTQLGLDYGRVLTHLGQAIFSIVGFNEGPEYLVGVKLRSLPWYPGWILAFTFFVTLILSIYWGVRSTFVKQNRLMSASTWVPLRWPVLLFVLILFLLIPPISTIRLEQRWLFSPFILMLFVGTWAAGQKKSNVRNPIWPLIVVLSASSILLDSVFVKHFNKVFFVYSARFAEMAKRDIADKYPGQSWNIDLLANPDHCTWSLLSGGFFRIYGGQAREVKCISLNDTSVETGFNSDVRVFSELSPGHLSDISDEWQARILAKSGRVSFDFINAFPSGQINNSNKVDTPTGQGVLILPSASVFGVEKTMTVISGFSYRFDNVLIEQGSQLHFGLSMIYPAEPVRAVVYVVNNDGAEPEVLFSREIYPPRKGEKLRFSPVTLPLSAFTGKHISLLFAAEPTGDDISGQWLGFSNPQILLPVGS